MGAEIAVIGIVVAVIIIGFMATLSVNQITNYSVERFARYTRTLPAWRAIRRTAIPPARSINQRPGQKSKIDDSIRKVHGIDQPQGAQITVTGVDGSILTVQSTSSP